MKEHFISGKHKEVFEGIVAPEVEPFRAVQNNRYKRYLMSRLVENNQTTIASLEKATALMGRQLGKALDGLSSLEKNGYIASFCLETGFPNALETSSSIIKNTKTALDAVQKEQNLEIAYAGFESTCSVGKGTALPGSDVDYLTVLVRDTNVSSLQVQSDFIQESNSRLIDCKTPVAVITLEQLQRTADLLRKKNNRVVYSDFEKMGMSEWEAVYTRSLLANIRDGKADIINNLTPNEKAVFGDVLDIVHEEKRNNPSFTNVTKHMRREQLLNMFPEPSSEEQFVIIRALQVASEAIALDVSPNSPHKHTFASLLDKGILTIRENNLKAPWAPYPWLFRNMHIWFYTNGEHPFTEK